MMRRQCRYVLLCRHLPWISLPSSQDLLDCIVGGSHIDDIFVLPNGLFEIGQVIPPSSSYLAAIAVQLPTALVLPCRRQPCPQN